MPTSRLHNIERFIYSHYFVTALRLTFGVLLVFVIGYLATDTITASIAAIGATYVAFIDRPAPMWARAKEMFVGALLGVMGVSLTGFMLDQPLALTITMVTLAFFFSMLVVYGARGATVGLACMTLAIITMSSGLTPDKVVDYSLISVAGAFGYIVYSMLSGKLLQLREEQQCLSIALFATSRYLTARAHMYEDGVDIDQRYREMIGTQAQMIAAKQAAYDAMLGHMSAQSVQRSRERLIVWNVMIDSTVLLDLLISTQTDYRLLHQKLPQSNALVLMHDILSNTASELEQIGLAVARQTKAVDTRTAAHASLAELQTEVAAMKDGGFAQTEPETYAICLHILNRLTKMRALVDQMIDQTHRQAHTEVLQPSYLEKPLIGLVSSQSFSPKRFISHLRLDSAAFRYALRVSLAVALAMTAGMLMTNTHGHGYWIVLTVIVIMKPTFSLSKQRNINRLIGTLTGCVATFALLHLITDPNILLIVFAASLAMCFVFFVTSNYRVYSFFICITVLLMLHALLPQSVGLPLERAIDTIIGSVIALACSFVLPWWESKSMPSVAKNAISANADLLRAMLARLRDPQADPIDWYRARHCMQIAFSDFAQGFARMMAEPVSRQKYVTQYSNLVVLVHVMAAEIVNLLQLVEKNPQATDQIVAPLEDLSASLQLMQPRPEPQATAADASNSVADWTCALKQLQDSTQGVIVTGKQVGLSSGL
jgi:uncharacterized membrane protein YccC